MQLHVFSPKTESKLSSIIKATQNAWNERRSCKDSLPVLQSTPSQIIAFHNYAQGNPHNGKLRILKVCLLWRKELETGYSKVVINDHI